jgi:hypothetical protein
MFAILYSIDIHLLKKKPESAEGAIFVQIQFLLFIKERIVL